MRVNRAVEYDRRPENEENSIADRVGHYDRRPGRGEGGKGLVAAVPRADGVAGDNSKMISRVRS